MLAAPAAATPAVDVSDASIHAESSNAHGGASPLAVLMSYKGRSERATIGAGQPVAALFDAARSLFDLPPESFTVKCILKGKSLPQEGISAGEALGVRAESEPAAPIKLMVMASARDAVDALQQAKGDSSVASFAAEHGSRKAGVPTSRGALPRGKRK